MTTMDPSADGHAVTLVDWSHGLMLTVRCPDRAGIVAQLAASIQAAGGNIVELDQHTDVVEGDFWVSHRSRRGSERCRTRSATRRTSIIARGGLHHDPEYETMLASGGFVFVDFALPE